MTKPRTNATAKTKRNTTRKRAARKRAPECPVCGVVKTVPIFWGMPDTPLMAKAERGEVILAGCVIDAAEGESPVRWQCSCGHRFPGLRAPSIDYRDHGSLNEWFAVVRGRVPLQMMTGISQTMRENGLTFHQAYALLQGQGRIIPTGLRK